MWVESLQAGIELSSVVIFQSWELTISRVKLEDGGEYLCQASTHPPLAIITTLDVVGSSSLKLMSTSFYN